VGVVPAFKKVGVRESVNKLPFAGTYRLPLGKPIIMKHRDEHIEKYSESSGDSGKARRSVMLTSHHQFFIPHPITCALGACRSSGKLSKMQWLD